MRRALRPRVLIYLAILGVVAVALFTHLALRVPLKVDVIRDRGSLGREVEDGQIENVYRLQLINSAETARQYRISVKGLPGLQVSSGAEVGVDRAATHLVPVSVRAPGGSADPGSHRIEFHVEAVDDAKVSVDERATFYVPR
jgi:polyferredoxin